MRRIASVLANLTSAPLFLFWAPHAPHDPYQVPQAYLDKFAHIDQTERQFYAAMVSLLDDNVGRVVAMLQAAGRWDNTLLVASSDNWGPLGDGFGGNNWPLKGGKASNWEGGVRVNAFVAGGAVPAARRGTTEPGLIEIADWYTTFASLAGADPRDAAAAAAGLPAVDGLDMWPLLSGANASSPRTHIILGSSDDSDKAGNTIVEGVIRADGCGGAGAGRGRGRLRLHARARAPALTPATPRPHLPLPSARPPRSYKLILGKQHSAFWTGPTYPNSSTYPTGTEDCTAGCLFNVFTDPTEHDEVSAAHPAIVAELQALIADAAKTVFNPDRGTDDGTACEKAFNIHHGFFGPFLD